MSDVFKIFDMLFDELKSRFYGKALVIEKSETPASVYSEEIFRIKIGLLPRNTGNSGIMIRFDPERFALTYWFKVRRTQTRTIETFFEYTDPNSVESVQKYIQDWYEEELSFVHPPPVLKTDPKHPLNYTKHLN